MTTDSITRTAPPYRVVTRPGPGLATITDRRDGTTLLWARTLRGGGGWRRGGLPRRCANCGTTMHGKFYKPPPLVPPLADRLCLACVEGDEAGPQPIESMILKEQ